MRNKNKNKYRKNNRHDDDEDNYNKNINEDDNNEDEEVDNNNTNKFNVLKNENTEEETEEPDYFKIGLDYDNKKNYDKAIYNYKKAIIKNKCTESMFNLALIYEKRDVSEAINYYKMAILSGDKDAVDNLGLLYAYNNDYDNAEKYFKIAIKDNRYIFLYHYACSTYNRGLVEESKELFELYLKSKNINKQDKELFKNLYIVNNKLHRENGPAVIYYKPRTDVYYINNKFQSMSQEQSFNRWGKYGNKR